VLVITAGLRGRSFRMFREVSSGFVTTQVVAARISPPPATYADPSRATALYDEMLARLAALPGVIVAGAVNQLPIASPVYGVALRVEGLHEDVKHGLPYVDHLQSLTPGYLPAMGIAPLRGRAFTAGDMAATEHVALVSASLARHFWPNGDAIGKRIGYPFPSPWMTIVGVVPDVKLDNLRDTSAMAVYVPFAQRAVALRTGGRPEMTVVARTRG